MKSLSHVWLFQIPWTAVYQASLSKGFSRLEYWSGLSFPSPGDLPDLGIKPRSPALQADPLPSKPPGKPSYISDWVIFLIQILFSEINVQRQWEETMEVDGIYTSSYGQQDRTVGLGLESQVSSRQRSLIGKTLLLHLSYQLGWPFSSKMILSKVITELGIKD